MKGVDVIFEKAQRTA